MNDLVQLKVYESDLKKYGQSKSYHLLYTEAGCVFIPNHKPLRSETISEQTAAVAPKNGSFTFVIIQNNGTPQLRINQGSHYYLADKAEFVYAAGEIHFKNNEIVKITDQSGAYHLINPDSKTYDCYIASLKEVLSSVNLSFYFLEPYFVKPKTAPCNQMFRLFTKENTLLACVVIAGANALYHSLT